MLQNSKAFSGYAVNDKQAAEEFYAQILGLVIENNGMGLELKLAGDKTVFIYEKADHVPATFTILNFPVASIDAAIDELAANGVVMERYASLPAEQDERGILRGKVAGMGPDIAWFKDPAGNILSVLEN